MMMMMMMMSSWAVRKSLIVDELKKRVHVTAKSPGLHFTSQDRACINIARHKRTYDCLLQRRKLRYIINRVTVTSCDAIVWVNTVQYKREK